MTSAARSRARLKLLTRVATLLICVTVFALVFVQYAHVLGRNVAMVRELHSVQNDVKALQVRKHAQKREIKRLSDPAGSIPEIHERLHLVRPNETIIFLRDAKTQTP
ncbi:MAG: septum formation initiator family protein [Candidatus Eremiobacteraeota bacterium]|nr:septum formation initiator family protein [Candidatus Eremiobacteraeota bacterium]